LLGLFGSSRKRKAPLFQVAVDTKAGEESK
jgi:hypothetical protein